MREGEPGSSISEGKREFPQDTIRYNSTPCYDLFISKKEQCIMVNTTDYHPGMLYLTRSDLEKMIKRLEE